MKLRLIVFVIGFCIVGGILAYVSVNLRSGSEVRTTDWQMLSEADPMFVHAGAYRHLHFFDSDVGIAVTGLSISTTDDGGRSWRSVRDGSGSGFHGLIFTTPQSGWIVGSDSGTPLILTTSTRGLHWQDWKKLDFDQRVLQGVSGKIRYFSDICFDQSGKAWLVGNSGIVQAELGEKTVSISSVFHTPEIMYSVACGDAGDVWAVGQNGVYRYKEEWQRQELARNLRFVKVLADGSNVWLLGEEEVATSLEDEGGRGLLLKSENGGQSWTNLTPVAAPALFDLHSSKHGVWLIGSRGRIYFSKDSGTSWHESKSPTSKDLFEIYFLDSKTAWIAGDKATILGYRP